MCGIAGWYRRDGRPVAADIVSAQCESLRHRGPDDLGIMIDGNFGFGMRRLSILDIKGGHQPMETADGRFSIVFNGEIYNHLEVREPLIAAGYSFASHCDTETVLAAFAHWGNDAWPRLEGMFAVAVWDRQKRELHLARDPLGIKPLYLSKQGRSFAFASELKALLLLPEQRFEIDERAVQDFFCFGQVRGPRSIYQQVRTLEPGHYLTVGANRTKPSRAFWEPRIQPAENVSVADWTDQMRAMLLETTSRHMLADVPVGAFLSGGIDSSAILAAMTRSAGRPIKAFTIGYPGADMDETDAAREVARHLGCEHIVAPLDTASVEEMLPQVLSWYDEPFASQAAIPTWYMSKVAAEHVKVVLDGSGGDELFGGYKRLRNARTVARYRQLMQLVRPLPAMINHLPVAAFPKLNYRRQHLQRFTEFIQLRDGYQQFFAATQYTQSSLRRRLYTPDFWERQEGGDFIERLEREYFPDGGDCRASPLDQFMLADLMINLPSRGLTRIDRASMAHSLEVRVPFLSHKMVDWALTIPIDLKLHHKTGKYILRQAIEPWLPPAVFERRKQGFQMPLASWMRGHFGDVARAVWHDSGAAAAGYLDTDAVDRLFAEHRRGEANHGRILYAIAIFGSWWLRNQARVTVAPASRDARKPIRELAA